MLMITLYVEQKKRHRCIEQSFRLSGRKQGWMFQENSIKTCILSRVKQITSPGWMHETSAQAWCTEKTQRDQVEREVRGGIGMGNTCKSMAVSFQCMTKSTTITPPKKKKYKAKHTHKKKKKKKRKSSLITGCIFLASSNYEQLCEEECMAETLVFPLQED